MSIKVETKGPLFARPTSQIIGVAFREVAGKHGPDFVKLLKAEARKDTKAFEESIDYTVVGSGISSKLVLFANSASAQWAERGRKAGKGPPLEPTGEKITRGPNKGKEKMQSILVHWVERRGWGSTINERRGIAYVISKNIRRRGIAGQFIFRDFKQNHAAEVERFFADLEERMARLFGE